MYAKFSATIFAMSKKIKDTLLGNFLKKKAPSIASAVGNFLPEKGALGIVKNLLKNTDKETQQEAEIYLHAAIQEEEITKRWQADSKQRLSAAIRPAIVIASCTAFFIFTILDSLNILVLKPAYISILETLLLTTIGGYFVLRSADKYTQKN